MKRGLLFIYSLGISFLAGGIGSIFTISQIENWYSALDKPIFTPPNWVFGPVWNILYLLMGIALYLVITSKKSKERSLGFKLFYFQLILNTLWSIIFFGLENTELALVVILVLWGAIFMTIKQFQIINRTAGNLLLPYIVWVTIATLLNLGIVILN